MRTFESSYFIVYNKADSGISQPRKSLAAGNTLHVLYSTDKTKRFMRVSLTTVIRNTRSGRTVLSIN